MEKNNHHWAKRKKIERHKEAQYNFLKITFYAFSIIFVVIVFYVFFFSRFLAIENVKLDGIRDLEYSEIQNHAEQYLNEKTLFVFPRKNLLVFDGDDFEKYLKEKFKKIRSVSVSKKFPGEINISISERDLLLLWCSADECFMIDEEGKAYEKADLNSSKIKENDLIRVFDLSKKNIEEGGYILEGDYCEFVLALKKEIWKELGIIISSDYETSSRIADEVIVKTSEGWRMYFDSREPIEKSIENLSIFLKSEIDYEKRTNLEYVDLRAPNKIFYKLWGEDGEIKEQEIEDSEEAEAVTSDSGDDEVVASDSQEMDEKIDGTEDEKTRDKKSDKEK